VAKPLDIAVPWSHCRRQGRPREPDNQLPQTNYSAVSGAYFGAMRIPLLAGRVFDDRDDLQSPRVAIVSAELAQRVFPGESAIGKRINVTTGPESFREIVGVVGDVKQKGLAQETRPHVYEPFAQAPDPFMTLVVRTAGNPSAIVPAIRAKVFELDHELPLQRVTTLDKLISSSIRQQRFASAVLSVFAAVALVLALAGLYGVISYSVVQRTRELGIRVVLGADVRSVSPGEILEPESVGGFGYAQKIRCLDEGQPVLCRGGTLERKGARARGWILHFENTAGNRAGTFEIRDEVRSQPAFLLKQGILHQRAEFRVAGNTRRGDEPIA